MVLASASCGSTFSWVWERMRVSNDHPWSVAYGTCIGEERDAVKRELWCEA
jgi:hypothetical protein